MSSVFGVQEQAQQLSAYARIQKPSYVARFKALHRKVKTCSDQQLARPSKLLGSDYCSAQKFAQDHNCSDLKLV
ncbi:hypothetical protein RIF29_20904 [Crotalaria pallida]|uniref:Uncharacterized protein n=1 Tax=Crotalaria pallida TaxID=3830 RepID=A0AAN9ICW2_CROPI